MRICKFSAMVACVASVAAGLSPAVSYAQQRSLTSAGVTTTSDDSASVFATALRSFPSGGEPLAMEICDLVSKHSAYAPRFAMYLRTQKLRQAQDRAVRDGLACGLKRLGVVVPAGSNTNPLVIGLLLAAIGGGIYGLTSIHSSSSVSPN